MALTAAAPGRPRSTPNYGRCFVDQWRSVAGSGRGTPQSAKKVKGNSASPGTLGSSNGGLRMIERKKTEVWKRKGPGGRPWIQRRPWSYYSEGDTPLRHRVTPSLRSALPLSFEVWTLKGRRRAASRVATSSLSKLNWIMSMFSREEISLKVNQLTRRSQ